MNKRITTIILCLSLLLCCISPVFAQESVDAQQYQETATTDNDVNLKGSVEEEPETPVLTSIADAKVAGVVTKAYTGGCLKQSPTVSLNGTLLEEGIDYTLSYANNKRVGHAVMTICGTGDYTDSLEVSFRIIPAKPKKVVLAATECGFNVKWNKQTEQVSGFTIQYSTNRDFSSKVTRTIHDTSVNTKKMYYLKEKKTYYVRMRSFKTMSDEEFHSPWTTTKSVTTKVNSRIDKKVFNKGEGFVGAKFGHLTTKELLNFLSTHGGDPSKTPAKWRTYYLSTPYYGGDHRNPNGDKKNAYGELDMRGVAGMNCTGFVWHALYKASGLSVSKAKAQIPGLSGWCTCIKGKCEYKSYYNKNKKASNKEMIKYVLNDGYIKPGDIVWFWDGNVSFSWDGIRGYSKDGSPYHHVGIYTGTYWGDPKDSWWQSCGMGNVISPLMAGSSKVWGITVIKLSK